MSNTFRKVFDEDLGISIEIEQWDDLFVVYIEVDQGVQKGTFCSLLRDHTLDEVKAQAMAKAAKLREFLKTL